MDDIQKMFRTIITGQSAFRQEVLKKFDEVYKRFDSTENELSSIKNELSGVENELASVKSEVQSVRKELHQRMDGLGTQLAYLEDDAPTREEFEKLDKRVNKLEHQKTSTLS